jgi:hypothetical protein
MARPSVGPLEKTKHTHPRSTPAQSHPLLDYFQTRHPLHGKTSLLPTTDCCFQTKTPYTGTSLHTVQLFYRIDPSRSFQHLLRHPSSTLHSFNACRRQYRLRYEIRLNPIFTFDRTRPATTTPTSYAHLPIERSAIQSRASHSSPVSSITTARAIEQSQHQPCLQD